MNKNRLFWIIAITGLVFDQIVKAYIRGALAPHQTFNGLPLPGIFEITLTYNEGIAFGMLQGMGIFVAPIALVIAAAAAWYSAKNPQELTLSHVALGLLASGAIGNMIDRIWLGKVTDMFWFRAINFPVFNVADSCITVGTILLTISWLTASNQKSAEPHSTAETKIETPSV